ncbi:CopG family transcriptional regulator [Thermococci archaeon]|nr:MAG: CopG family transcriptional regulator [Thermococci archaeon]
MRLVSVQVPEKYVDDIDRLVVDGSFPNRSEAIRYAVRELLKRELWEKGE